MKAIILAGGFGTRLQPVLTDIPKPMAPINNKPFLAYLIDYLAQQGVHDIILSVHYLREQIQAYFKSDYAGVAIRYAIEESPLGTGGAMVHALTQIPVKESVFVLNGDTFVKLDYKAMYAQHTSRHAALTMALRPIDDCHRYGKVITEQGVIVDFQEKGDTSAGWINAGVYLLQPDTFTPFQLPAQFSFETDFVQPNLAALKPQSFAADDYFIDIGIPEDYARAALEIK
jgi:D-glycero-alpha-D-manno-heptose 1-phosphate guanylyltransferase